MKEREKVQAVHDNQLKEFFSNLGLLQKLKTGDLKCKFCKEPLTNENIYSIFPQGGDIKITCDKPRCIAELTSFLNER